MQSIQPAAAVITLILTIVVITLFGGVVFARTYRKAYGKFFVATMVGIILWSIGDLILLLARDANLLRLGAELFYISPMIIPAFIWFFAISFPEDRKPTVLQWLFVIALVSALACGFLWKFNFFINNIQIDSPLNTPKPQLPGFLLYSSYFSIVFLCTYATFFLKARQLKGQNRTQVSYTLYGALAASIPALITNLSLPIMGQKGAIWLGPFFTLFFAAAVTVAIIRHKLFDIRPVIVRSLAYTLTIVTVSMLYGFIVFGLAKLLFGVHLAVSLQFALAISTGFAALVFQSFKAYFDRTTKRLFYQDAYDPQEFFDEYNKSLVSTIDLDALLKKTTRVIAKHLKAEYCAIGVKEPQGLGYRIVGTDQHPFNPNDIAKVRSITPSIHRVVIVTDDIPIEHSELHAILSKNDVALLARLTINSHKTREGLGYLVIGPKKSGNTYTSQDVKTIEAAANELIIALQNALRFEEIERFNETLQQKVNLATKQLRESNRKLKKLNDTKDDFIGMASHQLRTPLTSVKGYLSLVLDGDAGTITDTQRKLLQQAFTSSQRVIFLIADLLNVSRLKTGKFVIERIPTNLSKMIVDEIGQLREAAAARNIAVEFKKPAHFPTLPLDEAKTRQVVMNFLDNAIYYGRNGGHITIELHDLPQSVELRVIDDGIGVPKAEQHQLWTKFYRAKNAQKARPDGTGLGLYMAKKVIMAQGGGTIFDSVEGQGSTFGFTFPKDMPLETVTTPIATTK